VAGAAGRLNPAVWTVDWNNSYNILSGLIGGLFLSLAYFGCDQSQVQRYLTGKSIAQAKLSLLFNAVAKIPMQFMILFTGAMVFVFFTFTQPPVTFDPGAAKRIESSAGYARAKAEYDVAWQARKDAAAQLPDAAGEFKAAQKRFDDARSQAAALAGVKAGADTNYIFLSFVTRYMPVGIVGLIMAAIFAAAMSTISAEVNSLATVSVVDVYKRYVRKDREDRHYLRAARWATAFWGIYAMVTARYASNLGSLIEVVNKVGSLFYGGLIGVFILAFFVPRATAKGALGGVLAGEAAIFYMWLRTDIFYLWFNALGCLVVVAAGYAISLAEPRNARNES